MASDAKTRPLNCGMAVDRISNLPRNLIDLILERLPIHDAARTSILSKTWRDIWVMHPHLVFDEAFFKQLLSKKVSKKDKQAQPSAVSRTISNILFLHTGPILKFHLSIPHDLPLHQCLDMDFWIKKISNGVRKLELFNKHFTAYKMPLYLFSCLELADLRISKCILNPPLRFGGLCNLISVELVYVTITADMSFGTQLEELILKHCTGIEHLGCQFKYNNNLTQLRIERSGKIDWGWFECIQKMKILVLNSLEYSRNEIISLDKLVGNMPRINTLFLDDLFIESLKPGAAVLKRPITTLEKLYLAFGFYDLFHIQCVISLIRSLPNLRYLSVVLGPENIGDMDLLDSMVLSVMLLDKLETVEIKGMVGSRADFQFIKLLLASTPSLRWIKLEFYIYDSKEELRILRELLQIPRASTSSRVIWT